MRGEIPLPRDSRCNFFNNRVVFALKVFVIFIWYSGDGNEKCHKIFSFVFIFKPECYGK